MSKKYIHYGHTNFDRDLFVPVRNGRHINKPVGGLWASPVGAERGWYNWCKNNEFVLGRLKTSFEFVLSQNARVLELTPDNVWDLPVDGKSYFTRSSRHEGDIFCPSMVEAIDFEALAQEYDVLSCSLTENPSLYWSLYGWDCDCILVLNPDVIVEVSE